MDVWLGHCSGATWTAFLKGAEVFCAALTLLLCHCLSPPASHYQFEQFSSVSLEFDAIKC